MDSVDKITCPRNGSVRYINACEKNCSHNVKCVALERYRHPSLFDKPYPAFAPSDKKTIKRG